MDWKKIWTAGRFHGPAKSDYKLYQTWSFHSYDVLSSTQVIIGCGSGFRHECASRYSPVAQWYFSWVTIVKLRAVSANLLRPDDLDRSCCGGLWYWGKLGEGPTKYLISSGGEVSYRYSPFSSLSSVLVNETRPTPPSKCTWTDRGTC